MTQPRSTVDPIPPSAYPSFQPASTDVPQMPSAFRATVLLHPFSPPLSSEPKPDNPFFQLCTAKIVCLPGVFFYALVTGCSYGQWLYRVTPQGTEVSTDGVNWQTVDLGWSLPENWFGEATPTSVGRSPLNWMVTQEMDWWKLPVTIPGQESKAATWLWFDAETAAPYRMMFGYGPPSPTKGDPTQLAFFQMWSFSYFASYQIVTPDEIDAADLPLVSASIPGFTVGNPDNFSDFVWNSNFGMTAFMTPVNEAFNPLPTRVLYVWKPDSNYAIYSDRAQNTLMLYTYNAGGTAAQEALLTGPAPAGISAPNSESGFLITYDQGGSCSCQSGSDFPFPQEPPNWVSIPAVEGTIQATITNNPALAPGTTVTIFSVLFPPAGPNYPEATYLWTWYAPQAPDGNSSRPVTFMQSQSGVGKGTSLALADYYFYENLDTPIDPANFDIPSCCQSKSKTDGAE